MSAAKKYVPAVPFSVKHEPSLNEQWVKDLIMADPSILGIEGELQVIGIERRQSSRGRLDLLLRDVDSERRYELEVQLGPTDESHIVRTIEYWDLERKRDPHFDHCAVIVAEEITSRFFNIISLFNGHIPIIAIKMTAFEVADNITLSFTKVLDESCRGRDVSTDLPGEVTRATWEANTSKEALQIVDRLSSIVQEAVGRFDLKYNKYYIGCVVKGIPANFIVFKPQRSGFRIDLGIKLNPSQITALEEADVEVLPYTHHWKVHPIKLTKAQAMQPPKVVIEIIKEAYKDYFD